MFFMYIVAILAFIFYFYADPQTQERLAVKKEMEREEEKKEERNQSEHQTGSFFL